MAEETDFEKYSENEQFRFKFMQLQKPYCNNFFQVSFWTC
jgi:hypothetical protein